MTPTLAVQETFRPKQTECHSVTKEGEMILFRDRLVPLVRLERLFEYNGGASSGEEDPKVPWEQLAVVVENQEKRRCLLADELLGQEEVVIKNLGESLQHVRGIAGGAILGDGRVGLILDIAGIIEISSGGV